MSSCADSKQITFSVVFQAENHPLHGPWKPCVSWRRGSLSYFMAHQVLQKHWKTKISKNLIFEGFRLWHLYGSTPNYFLYFFQNFWDSRSFCKLLKPCFSESSCNSLSNELILTFFREFLCRFKANSVFNQFKINLYHPCSYASFNLFRKGITQRTACGFHCP